MKTIEEKLATNQLDRLAKHWSGMKGKRIQPSDAIKLSAMVGKFGKDELEQLATKDIPFLSMSAINNLMIKHNYSADQINGLMKENTEYLYDLYMFEDVDAGEYDYEGDMAKTQLITIADAAEELHDMLEDDENLPEWCQNKITKAMDYLDTVRDYMIAKDTDEEPGNENPNESVKQEMFSEERMAAGRFGKNVHDIKIKIPARIDKVIKKASPVYDQRENKPHKAIGKHLKDIMQKHGVKASGKKHYHNDMSGHYMFAHPDNDPAKVHAAATEFEKTVGKAIRTESLDEGNMASAAKELETYARKSGGIDKNDFIKAAMMMKRNQKKQLDKFVDELDTEPREKILSVMDKHLNEGMKEPFDEKKGDLHLYNNEADARKKAKEVSGKVIKGTGKSAGKWAVKEKVELDEKVNAKAIQKAVDDGKSMDVIMTMFANKRTTNTDEIRKVVKDYMWKKRMKKEEVELDEKFEPKTVGMKIVHKKPHPAGGQYVVLSKPGAGQYVIRHLNKGQVKTLGTVPSLGLAKSYIDAKSKGKDPKDLLKTEEVSEKAPKIDSKKFAAHMSRNTKPKTMTSTQKSLSSISRRANEKLSVADGMGAWIDDFKQSDAPQFKGKTAKERRDMAIAAYLSAKKDNE